MLLYLLAGIIAVFGLQFGLIYHEEKNVSQSLKDIWSMMIKDGSDDDEVIVIYWFCTVAGIIAWPFTLCYFAQLHVRKQKK